MKGMERELSWLREDLFDDDQQRRALAHTLGVPFVTLTPHDIFPDALFQIPEPLCRAHNLLPYRSTGGNLEVALLSLEDLPALDHFRSKLPYKILPRLTDRASLKRGLLTYQKLLKERFGDQIQEAVTNGEPPALVDALLSHALNQGASQVHLEQRDRGLLVRYRHGTLLRDAMTMPLHVTEGLFDRLKSLAHIPAIPGSHKGRFRTGGEESPVSVQVTTIPTLGGEKITLHLTRERTGQRGYALETLGLHGQALEALHRALAQRQGLIIVSGPTDSGVSTLLYTMLDILSSPERNIVTIEERIDHRLLQVTHTAVNPEIGMGIGSGLRALLKTDPDVVLVSNIPDTETASLVLHAANRGVLVLAGLSAPSAALGIEQLRSLGGRSPEIAAVLQAAVGTRLLRKLCPHREQYRPARIELSMLEAVAHFATVLAALRDEGIIEKMTAWKDLPFSRPVPCSACQGGYLGRIGIQEVLSTTARTRSLIEQGATAEELAAAARADGMLTLLEDGIYKALQGETSLEELLLLAAQ